MALERKPNTPYDPDRLTDPAWTTIDDRHLAVDHAHVLQPDPELADDPASNTRVAIMALGIAIVLGAVFYGLNNSSVQPQASSVPTPVNTAQNNATALPAAPPGMRDVTPRSNSQPGMTTGSAPANPGSAK